MKKWRNKITGEINEFMVHKRIEDSEDGNPVYAPFDGRIDEWEDMPEEPKVGYIIDPMEEDCVATDGSGYEEPDVERAKELGIWFETKEEAEKAVEKLKAWKRLKDKGFKAISSNICGDDFVANFKLTNHVDYSQSMDDFDCILDFGGEE